MERIATMYAAAFPRGTDYGNAIFPLGTTLGLAKGALIFNKLDDRTASFFSSAGLSSGVSNIVHIVR